MAIPVSVRCSLPRERARDAEVGDERVVPAEEDVLGLDVAVDHPVAVRVLERVGRLAGDAERVLERELFLAREPVAEAFAFDEGHGEPELAGRLARVEHREDVRMLEPGGELDLAQEPLGAQRRGELGVQHLERDGAVVPQVVREVDRGHAAAAELALELVAVRECCREDGAGVGAHAAPSTSFLNRGLLLSGSKVGSILSHPGDRLYGIRSSGSSRSSAFSGSPTSM